MRRGCDPVSVRPRGQGRRWCRRPCPRRQLPLRWPRRAPRARHHPAAHLGQDREGDGRTGVAMRLDEAAPLGQAFGAIRPVGSDAREPACPDARFVEGCNVPACRIVEVGQTAGHAGPEVCPDGTEDHHGPAGHVLAAVGPDALDDCLRPAVADREPHLRPPDEVKPAGRRAIETGVAGDRRGLGDRPEIRFPERRPRCLRRGPCRRSHWPGRRGAGSARRSRILRTTGPPSRAAPAGSAAAPRRARLRRRARPRTSGRLS